MSVTFSAQARALGKIHTLYERAADANPKSHVSKALMLGHGLEGLEKTGFRPQVELATIRTKEGYSARIYQDRHGVYKADIEISSGVFCKLDVVTDGMKGIAQKLLQPDRAYIMPSADEGKVLYLGSYGLSGGTPPKDGPGGFNLDDVSWQTLGALTTVASIVGGLLGLLATFIVLSEDTRNGILGSSVGAGTTITNPQSWLNAIPGVFYGVLSVRPLELFRNIGCAILFSNILCMLAYLRCISGKQQPLSPGFNDNLKKMTDPNIDAVERRAARSLVLKETKGNKEREEMVADFLLDCTKMSPNEGNQRYVRNLAFCMDYFRDYKKLSSDHRRRLDNYVSRHLPREGVE